MSWSFDIERDAAIRELIKIAEKTEADTDMEQVQEIGKKDAELYVANPEAQEALLKEYADSIAKGLSGFFTSPFVKGLADHAAEYRQKSKQHLDTLITKYVTAKPIFEQEYDLVFINTVLAELNKKWLSSQQPGTYTKTGDEAAAAPSSLPGKAPLQAPVMPRAALQLLAADSESRYPGLIPYDESQTAIAPWSGRPFEDNGEPVEVTTYDKRTLVGRVVDAYWSPELKKFVYQVDTPEGDVWIQHEDIRSAK